MSRIALIGLPGCGKSVVGRVLSDRLQHALIDLDERIVQTAGMSIPEIFRDYGEPTFRQWEWRALNAVRQEQDSDALVLATGGGIVETSDCRDELHKYWYTVYLSAQLTTLFARLRDERDGRPLLHGQDSLEQRLMVLHARREAYYQSTASLVIAVDDLDVDDVAETIVLAMDTGGE